MLLIIRGVCFFVVIVVVVVFVPLTYKKRYQLRAKDGLMETTTCC